MSLLSPHTHTQHEIPFTTFVSKQFICIYWQLLLPSVPPGRQPSRHTHIATAAAFACRHVHSAPPWYVVMACATSQSNPLFAAFLLRYCAHIPCHLHCDFCHNAFVCIERCFAYQLMPVNIAYCFVNCKQLMSRRSASSCGLLLLASFALFGQYLFRFQVVFVCNFLLFRCMLRFLLLLWWLSLPMASGKVPLCS